MEVYKAAKFLLFKNIISSQLLLSKTLTFNISGIEVWNVVVPLEKIVELIFLCFLLSVNMSEFMDTGT